MSKYSKLFVALSASATLATTALSDGQFTTVEGAQIALSVIGAFLVWLVPNYTPPKEPQA